MTSVDFVHASPGQEMKITLDGIEISFTITDYSNTGGYATVNVHNSATKESFVSYGQCIVNGHSITTTWKQIYDTNRDNYVCSKELHITID